MNNIQNKIVSSDDLKRIREFETWTIYTDQNSKQWWLKRIRKLKHEQYIQNKIVRSDD